MVRMPALTAACRRRRASPRCWRPARGSGSGPSSSSLDRLDACSRPSANRVRAGRSSSLAARRVRRRSGPTSRCVVAEVERGRASASMRSSSSTIVSSSAEPGRRARCRRRSRSLVDRAAAASRALGPEVGGRLGEASEPVDLIADAGHDAERREERAADRRCRSAPVEVARSPCRSCGRGPPSSWLDDRVSDVDRRRPPSARAEVDDGPGDERPHDQQAASDQRVRGEPSARRAREEARGHGPEPASSDQSGGVRLRAQEPPTHEHDRRRCAAERQGQTAGVAAGGGERAGVVGREAGVVGADIAARWCVSAAPSWRRRSHRRIAAGSLAPSDRSRRPRRARR